MNYRAFSKSFFIFASTLALICAPGRAIAKHGGSKGSGGSHGGSSHGGGSRGGHSFHGSSHGASHPSSHSSFKSSGHASRGDSRSSERTYSAGMGGGRVSGRFDASDRNYAGSRGGFSSHSSNAYASRGFGSAEGARNFGGFGQERSYAGGGTRAETGQWRSFGNSGGNSGGRSMLASAHATGNFAGNGWHSFGNANYGRVANFGHHDESSRLGESQWRSFGNSKNYSSSRNFAGFSSFGTGRVSTSRFHSFNPAVENHSFASQSGSRRFSSSSSFSSRRFEGDFEGSRFGGSNFGRAGFANAGFSGTGFENGYSGSALDAGLSLFPNLLNTFLNFGGSAFGGPGVLAANALSLAVRLFVSAASSGDSGQDGYAEANNGFVFGAPSGAFGFTAAPEWTACAPAGPLWAAELGPGSPCGSPGFARFSANFVGTGQPAGSGFNFGLGLDSRR